ncbi:MAG: NYN domain-containing protein [Chloroflexi bacterium]|nr:NYN domain-containing protein [Chloroflexota bacterium]
MDRSALLIDAGYLLVGAGGLCTGAKRRQDIECDYSPLHEALSTRVEEHSGLPKLRTYWYDGAPGPHGELTADHHRIASLPNLKLRLGRVIHGQQKGVDTLITLDLLTLARERSVATVYLLTGDEDLREAVVAAQSLGVQVVLLGVPPRDGSRQSFTLINECDEHLMLDEAFWDPHFRRVTPAPRPPVSTTAAENAESVPEEESARRVGARHCESWVAQADSELVRLVVEQAPRIPKEVDAPMLRTAEREFGPLRDREQLRRIVRQGFLERLAALSEQQPP